MDSSRFTHRSRCFSVLAALPNERACQQGQRLLYPAGSLNSLGMPTCWVKEREVKTHTPIGAVAWSVGIVFATDLNADRLLPNLKNLADLKNHRHGPFPVVGRSVPVCCGFRTKGESRMSLRGVG
jgi:hypothetical protein